MEADYHVVVALAVAVDVPDAFAFEADLRAGLGAGGNPDLNRAIDGFDVFDRPQSGFGK